MSMLVYITIISLLIIVYYNRTRIVSMARRSTDPHDEALTVFVTDSGKCQTHVVSSSSILGKPVRMN